MINQVWKKFAAHEVSHSVAHYLTTIHDLHERRGYARVSDVAKELEVTKGSVSMQVKHLRDKGWVSEDDNRFLRLTELGESVAREVLENRRVLIEFLNKVLGVEAEQAETDACKIEHLLSHETGQQIMALVELLQSEDDDARQFLKKLKGFKVRCPSLGECRLCEEQCLMEVEPCPLTGTQSPR
jgi:Mn-dependent DtxR family transcriptional regulator